MGFRARPSGQTGTKPSSNSVADYSRRRRGDRLRRGSGNPDHVESARLKWAVRYVSLSTTVGFTTFNPLDARVQRLTAPISRQNGPCADFPRQCDDPEAVAL